MILNELSVVILFITVLLILFLPFTIHFQITKFVKNEENNRTGHSIPRLPLKPKKLIKEDDNE